MPFLALFWFHKKIRNGKQIKIYIINKKITKEKNKFKRNQKNGDNYWYEYPWLTYLYL